MTLREKGLLIDLLERIKGAGGQSKDSEAEALINNAVAQQPDASYLLVQTVLIQKIALDEAQIRLQHLERHNNQ